MWLNTHAANALSMSHLLYCTLTALCKRPSRKHLIRIRCCGSATGFRSSSEPGSTKQIGGMRRAGRRHMLDDKYPRARRLRSSPPPPSAIAPLYSQAIEPRSTIFSDWLLLADADIDEFAGRGLLRRTARPATVDNVRRSPRAPRGASGGICSICARKRSFAPGRRPKKSIRAAFRSIATWKRQPPKEAGISQLVLIRRLYVRTSDKALRSGWRDRATAATPDLIHREFLSQCPALRSQARAARRSRRSVHGSRAISTMLRGCQTGTSWHVAWQE
jgi:hypothetical protein